MPIDDHRDWPKDALLLLRCHAAWLGWRKVSSRACGQDCAASSEGFKVQTGLKCSTKRMSIIWAIEDRAKRFYHQHLHDMNHGRGPLKKRG